jgi:peptidoglycan/LPS O-acetylase OafA/YrhL
MTISQFEFYNRGLMRRARGIGESSMEETRRIPELDGLRGVAVLSVVIAHYFCEVPGGLQSAKFGWLGVDLFFVLSGFLIGGILLDNRGSPRYFATFYLRRACRIFPVYYVVLAVVLTLAALFAGNSWLDAPLPAPAYLTYTQNIVMAETGRLGVAWLLPTWTLAVEEQFYFLLPVIIFLTPRRYIISLALTVIAAAPLFRVAAFATMNDVAAGMLLPSRCDLLFFGVLSAAIYRQPALWSRATANGARALKCGALIGVTGICAVLAATAWFADRDLIMIMTPTVGGLLCSSYVLLMVSGAPEAARFRSPFLRFFGAISYGLYLIHQPICGLMHGILLDARPDIANLAQLAVTGAALALSVGLAFVSWTYFEAPIVRFGRQLTKNAGMPVTA